MITRLGVFRRGPRPSREEGMVLVVVLGVMVLLSVLVLTLRRAVGVELALARYAVGETRARYLAAGGLTWVIAALRADALDPESRRADTLYACGFSPPQEGVSRSEYFAPVELTGGTFQVADREGRLGLVDEERYLNVNTLPAREARVLIELVKQFSDDDAAARRFAAAVIDERDTDHEMVSLPSGTAGPEEPASEDGSQKNAPFDHPVELAALNGMTPALWQQVRPFITVAPSAGRFQINLNTVSETVLLALARGIAGPGISRDDADALVDKILRLRRGPDGEEATADDGLVTLKDLSLNTRERALFLTLARYHSPVSRYVRARVVGTDAATGIRGGLSAVIRRQDLAVLSWETE